MAVGFSARRLSCFFLTPLFVFQFAIADPIPTPDFEAVETKPKHDFTVWTASVGYWNWISQATLSAPSGASAQLNSAASAGILTLEYFLDPTAFFSVSFGLSAILGMTDISTSTFSLSSGLNYKVKNAFIYGGKMKVGFWLLPNESVSQFGISISAGSLYISAPHPGTGYLLKGFSGLDLGASLESRFWISHYFINPRIGLLGGLTQMSFGFSLGRTL